MASKKVLRHQRIYYINIGSEDKPEWVLLGDGINSLTVDMGSTVEDDHYIIFENGTSTRTGINKSWSISGDMIVGDKAQDYILSLSDKLGSEAEGSMVEVDTWKTTDTDGVYEARKYGVLYDTTNDGGGDAGSSLQIEVTIHSLNDYTTGTWNKATKTFTDKSSD